jgi:hypothetical protein
VLCDHPGLSRGFHGLSLGRTTSRRQAGSLAAVGMVGGLRDCRIAVGRCDARRVGDLGDS